MELTRTIDCHIHLWLYRHNSSITITKQVDFVESSPAFMMKSFVAANLSAFENVWLKLSTTHCEITWLLYCVVCIEKFQLLICQVLDHEDSLGVQTVSLGR